MSNLYSYFAALRWSNFNCLQSQRLLCLPSNCCSACYCLQHNIATSVTTQPMQYAIKCKWNYQTKIKVNKSKHLETERCCTLGLPPFQLCYPGHPSPSPTSLSLPSPFPSLSPFPYSLSPSLPSPPVASIPPKANDAYSPLPPHSFLPSPLLPPSRPLPSRPLLSPPLPPSPPLPLEVGPLNPARGSGGAL